MSKKIYDRMFQSRNPNKGYYDMDGVPNVPTEVKRKHPEVQEAFVKLQKLNLSPEEFKKRFDEGFVFDSIKGNAKKDYLLD
tara:strand:- start:115 stop:357 length:243 start_codon:yes stop_codon:yes gene_type:complete